jgi:tripartite-type tricarboxylate transporter receptor subunit TctC
MPREIITRRALIAASPLLAAPALAQAPFPNRPIRLVVGFTPGGATDISARAFAPKMSEVLGQPVIVENRPGAGSNLATEIVARSPADGYTILLATLGALVISPMVMRLPIDPARDLVPISIAVDGLPPTSSLPPRPAPASFPGAIAALAARPNWRACSSPKWPRLKRLRFPTVAVAWWRRI